MLQCNNILCVYCNENHSCERDDVRLNFMGVCTNCVPVMINENMLSQTKRTLRDELKSEECKSLGIGDKSALKRTIIKTENYLEYLNKLSENTK